MKTELIAQAESLGFALCRIAPCTAPPHAAEFRAWLEDGRAGEMAWLARNTDRRTDPQQVLPGAKSVVVLAMNYWQGGENDECRMTNVERRTKDETRMSGNPISSFFIPHSSFQIARYAWGDDYHDIIEAKLRTLDAWLT